MLVDQQTSGDYRGVEKLWEEPTNRDLGGVWDCANAFIGKFDPANTFETRLKPSGTDDSTEKNHVPWQQDKSCACRAA